MYGRIIQASGPLRLAIVDGLDVREDRRSNIPRRYNGAPSRAANSTLVQLSLV